MTTTREWDQSYSRLRDILVDLSPDEFVVVSEPVEEPGPRRGLLRRRPEPPPVRYVQFRNDDGRWLYGECVGARLFGGDWEINEEHHQELRRMGWLAPGDPDPAGVQPSVRNYWVLLERGEASTLARMGIHALALLDADPGTLSWRRDS